MRRALTKAVHGSEDQFFMNDALAIVEAYWVCSVSLHFQKAELCRHVDHLTSTD